MVFVCVELEIRLLDPEVLCGLGRCAWQSALAFEERGNRCRLWSSRVWTRNININPAWMEIFGKYQRWMSRVFDKGRN